MAKSNAERQAKWREANRALFNLRRRNARKKAKGGDAICGANKPSKDSEVEKKSASKAGLTVRPAGSATIQGLRELITKESERAVEPSVAAPTVFRDDYGRVISESQWKRLQRRKEKAKVGWV